MKPPVHQEINPDTQQPTYSDRVVVLVAQSCLTVAHQTPLTVGFSRQEYWRGLLFPSPEGLPDPGTESGSIALWADSLPSELQGSTYSCRPR